MDVVLCNNASEANIINKSITELVTRSCTVKGNVSLEAPIIVLEYDSSKMPVVNYMKIPDYNRCYYITEVIALTGSR